MAIAIDNILELDNSAISTYAICQLRYKLSNVLKRRSKVHRVATDIGSACHDIMDHYFRCQDIAPVIEKWRKLISESQDINDISKFYSAFGLLIEEYQVTEDANGTRMVTHMPLSSDGVTRISAERWIIRYPEQPFRLPFGERWNYTGRMDCILEDGNGQYFVWELKTSGSASNSLWQDARRISSQPKGYVRSAEYSTSKPIAGAIIVPVQINKRDAKIQPLIMLRYTSQQLDSWENETKKLFNIIEVKTQLDDFQPTGMYSGACASKDYGKCEFYEYCRSGFIPGILEQSTEHNDWSPFNEK